MRRKIEITTIQFSSGSVAALRGRQSVRTTFKLSERAINALSIMACQLGIKQKSLFDHLVDDENALKQIAKEAGAGDIEKHRTAKTYVVSRRTLDNLEKISQIYNTPRDVLVELSIERIVPLIEQEKIKHERRKKLHDNFEKLLETGRELIMEADQEFELDDPVFEKYVNSLRVLDNSVRDVRDYLEKTQKVEEFNL